MKKRTLVGIGVVFVLILVVLFSQTSSAGNYENIDAIDGEVEIYKSVTCGCCGIYANYFSGKADPRINTLDVQESDLYAIKEENGIPQELESCHTTIIEGYFVEGHVPLEAIEKLLSEKPDIAGIAMPGMPSGSPGMPGQKYGDFVVHSVNHDGTYQEFMRI